MKKFAKSLLAASILSMPISPAYAGTITTPTYGSAVVATGSIDYTAFFTRQTCLLTMPGTVVQAVGTTLDHILLSDTGGACPDGIDIRLEAMSPTQVKARITIQAPFGICSQSNVLLPWSGSAINQPTPVAIGFCTMHSLNLSISPTVTII